MDVSAAFLCDFAETREGLLIAVGGGITRVYKERYPAPLGLVLALLVDVAQSELDIPHDLTVAVMGPDSPVGEVRGGFQIGRAPDLEPGELVVAPLTLDLRGIELPHPGSYSLHVTLDGARPRTVSFVSQSAGERREQET